MGGTLNWPEAFAAHDARMRRYYVAYAVALAVGFLVVTRTTLVGPIEERAYVDLSVSIAPLVAGGLALLRARSLPSPRSVAWLLMGSGALAWGVGNVGWTYLELWSQRSVPWDQRELPFPSVADVGYVLFLPFMLAATLAMVVGTIRVTTRLRTLLDGLLIGSCVLFAAWAVFLRPIVHYAGQQETAAAQVLAITYPLGDLVLLSMLILLASRSPPEVQKTLVWLGGALVAFTAGDVGFWYYTALGEYATGAITDVGWLLAFLLLGFAALRPIPTITDSDTPRPGAFLTVLPLIPFGLSTLVAMVVQVQEGFLEPFLFWNAIVVIALLTTRQVVALFENLGLRRDVEEAFSRLKRLEDERSIMLRAISHDIQNPLTPLKIQVELAGNRIQALEDPELANSFSIIKRSLGAVERLTQDLGDVVRIHDARLKLDLVDVDLARIIRDAAQTHEGPARQRGVAISAEVASAVPARVDSHRIHQVLSNLISNALKFTPAGGSVVVAARPDTAGVRVEIRDTGRGLVAEEIAKLFQPFSQVHDRKDQQPTDRGSGLGLYISSSIVGAHGGSMGVTSAGRGKGSTFWFNLPGKG